MASANLNFFIFIKSFLKDLIQKLLIIDKCKGGACVHEKEWV